MFAVIVSRINCQVSFLTIIIWSFVLLLLAVVVKGLAKFDVEGEIRIKEYISLKEELIPKTYMTNWTRVRKVVKTLGVI